MSVNITVNGKFAKHCPHPLLVDPQESIKAEEKERRKLRLLQVREQSKKLAKKIRDEVNEEKRKELQKLQATKERELECWRQHALQRKGEEYRSAIFQIGTAHQAAKKENKEKYTKQSLKNQSYKNFKKQFDARKSQPGKVQFSCQPFCPCQQTVNDSKKEFKCTCTQTEQNQHEETKKRKRDFSFSSSDTESEVDDYKEQSSFSLSSTCDSTSYSNNIRANQPSMYVPTKNKGLIKTPAVHLDLEVGTDDSVTITAPTQIKEKHSICNRQFNSIIRLSPKKNREQSENTSENPTIQHLSTTTSLSSDMPLINDNIATKSCLEKNENQNVLQSPKEKRFTIISELVKKQHENRPTTTNKQIDTWLPKSQATSAAVTPHVSPSKLSKQAVIQAPEVQLSAQSPRKSRTARTATTQTYKTFATTTTPISNSATNSHKSSSGRVQFYDYNSKLAKDQEASTAVNVQKQRDHTQPSAMEQAKLENLKERERQLEELKKCQMIEDRGQKALEREQIRRDCNELTEKLEVLSREYANQLPTNQFAVFADKQLRKEGKMNSAIEKLLQRPSIITCSEQNKMNIDENKQKPATIVENSGNLLNVASLNEKSLPTDDVSSDSCCSILLGYVDDQSRLVKQDLENNDTTKNQSKQKRLKNLLKRLDQLRSSLIEELKTEYESRGLDHENEKSKFYSNEENLRRVFDNISEMRKEHEQIFINEKGKNSKLLEEREKDIQAKEQLLNRKIKEFFEMQKQKTLLEKEKEKVSSKKENFISESLTFNNRSEDTNVNCTDEEEVVCSLNEDPLEIIITVKGQTKSIKIPQRPKRKFSLKKSPSKLSTLIKIPQSSLSKAKKHTPKKNIQSLKSLNANGILKRQNSYDSNSTSYMSLPPELPTKIDNLAQLIAKECFDQRKETAQQEPKTTIRTSSNHNQAEAVESVSHMPRFNPPPHINPLIAQYVNRLLGMSRDAVHTLGVSSSDIETPGSSIINTTSNIGNSDLILSDERLKTLHNFIEENKSFIKDIEESIRSHNNTSLESSMRMLDDIWRKRFKSKKVQPTHNKKVQTVKKKEQSAVQDKKIEQKSCLTNKEKPHCNDKNAEQNIKNMPIRSKGIERNETTHKLPKDPKDFSKSVSSEHSSTDKESSKSINQTYKRRVESVDKAVDAKLSLDTSKTESDSQIARYAKLTENCTHRIAELTELINRVRKEKQRLLEVTLSSVSDNGRHSTEYFELPEGKSNTRTEQDDLTRGSSSSEESTQNKQSHSSNTLPEMHKLSLADKNKQIANSRDSGIAESRPITAQENRNDLEPLSQTSSESTMPQVTRKMKPPPTLKRFSPQLPEDELAHELSTIFEVDTPATSRINTAVGQIAEECENAFNNHPQEPVKFPTFEEYIKQLNLDISQMSAERNMQLQQEYTTFLECLQKTRFSTESPKYFEFPSINAYTQHFAEGDAHIVETIEESLAKLRISGIQPHNFPAVREYVRQNTSKSIPADEQLLDTESLENITDNDTASIDIQEELKKRCIIKNSFRVTETKKRNKNSNFYQDILAAESGLDKISTSDNTSDLLDNNLKRNVDKRLAEVIKKTKDVTILSSTTTSSNASALARSALRAASLDDSKESGCGFNLREFLTRELQKRANNSDSTTNSSSDETLRSNFLHSLIGSLTPNTVGAASKSGGQTLDRQKTSTPVPMHSSRANSACTNHSISSSQLFSGESHLSSVHYRDRSVRFISSEDAQADQSSE